MPFHRLAGVAAVLVLILLVGPVRRAGPPVEPVAGAATLVTRAAPCAVGERPDYYYPGRPSPFLLAACARLPVSGKRVDFSLNRLRIGSRSLCVNPVYGGGFHIRAVCHLRPPIARFAVRDDTAPAHVDPNYTPGFGPVVPRLEDYGYVIWGTAGDAREVSLRHADGTARAAVLDVPGRVTATFGAQPFALFVAELPLAAGCAPVAVRAGRRTVTLARSRAACGLHRYGDR